MPENPKKNQDGLIIAGFILAFVASVVFWAMGQRNLAMQPIDEENSNTPETAIEDSQPNNPSLYIEPITIEQQKNPSFSSSGKSLQQIISTAQTWQPVYRHLFGKEAPDFALADLNGRQHRLSDYRGKQVLLIFWATWCPPCRAEIPDLIKLRNRFSEDELVIL
ncbi:MAG: TlpA disulfide reductase family protein, partial [Phycisphaerae bacterium]